MVFSTDRLIVSERIRRINPVGPWDIHATMMHCYGIDPDTVIHDSGRSPHPLSKGTLIEAILDNPDRRLAPLDRKSLIPAIPADAAVTSPAKPLVTSVHRTRVNKADGLTLMYVPGGEFAMGSEAYSIERPVHLVKVRPFWMSRTHVTTSMYV